jgi:CelD/BcsL family acetyltransferase involved in cellulose biosynthesis
MLTIRELSEKEFLNFKKEWNELLSKSRYLNIFLTWEWIVSWWETFNKGKKLKILLGYDNDELIGIAPLYLEEKALVNYIKFLGDKFVDSNYLNLIAQPEFEKIFASQVIGALSDDYFIYLRYMEKNDSMFFDKVHVELSNTFIIDLPQSIETYHKSLSRSKRYKLKKFEKKIFKEYKGDIFFPESPEKALEIVFDLNKKRWYNSKIDGEFSPKLKVFLKRIIEKTLNKKLKILVLRANKQPIAYSMNFVLGDTVYVYSMAYDATYNIPSKYGVGKCLLYNTIKKSISTNKKYIDLLRGESQYKKEFCQIQKTNVGVMLYKPTFRNNLAEKSITMLNNFTYLIQSNFSRETQDFLLKFVPKKLLYEVR